MNYVLNWQATLVVFVVMVLVMWVLNAIFKMPKWATFLVAVALTLAARYYWWWVSPRLMSLMRFAGLEV